MLVDKLLATAYICRTSPWIETRIKEAWSFSVSCRLESCSMPPGTAFNHSEEFHISC